MKSSLVLALLLVACAAPEATVVETSLALPPAPGLPTASPTSEAVAAELALQPEGTRPREVAEALLDLDVVSAAAARDGYWTPAALEIPWTRLLAKALLKERFEQDYDESRVPEGDLARIWDEHKEIRIQFDHYDSIEVADVQYLCCAKRYTDCDAAATAACIEKSRPVVDALFEEHVAGREHNEFSLKYLAEKVLQPRDPHVAFMRYSFFYDPSLPWDEQKKFHQYNRAIVEAAAATPVHDVARPVASNNGLHILYVMKHEPGVHRDVSDPEVEATVRQKALPSYRQRDLVILMDDLMLKAGLKIHEEVATTVPLGFRR